MGSAGSDTQILESLAALALTLLLIVAVEGSPQNRIALVIGNADYPASSLRKNKTSLEPIPHRSKTFRSLR